MVILWAPLLFPAGGAAEDSLPPDLRRALQLLQETRPERREEGERAIRALGKKAVEPLRAWLARSEGSVELVRSLLREIEGGAQEPEDELSAARPLFGRRLREAWERFHHGEYFEAERIARSVLCLDPESPELWQVRRLVRLSEDRLIQKELFEPTVEFRGLVYEADEVPRVLFRLRNHAREKVTIRTERGVLGTLQVSFQRVFPGGSSRLEERTIPLILSRTLVRGEESDPGEPILDPLAIDLLIINPGESHEQEVAIPAAGDPRERVGCAVRIRAIGKFQPSQWGIREENLTRVLTLAPAECWVVPRGQKALCEVPIRKLESALILKDLEAIFIGGQLTAWAAEDDPLLNDRLLGTLVQGLDDLDEPGIDVADALLQSASGVRRDPKLETAPSARLAAYWREWWRERTARGAKARGAPSPLPKFLDRKN